MMSISKTINFVALTTLIGVFAFVAIACGQEAEPTQAPAPAEQATPIELPTTSEDVAVESLPEAPDFTLPAANRDSTEISLTQFQGDQPVVLVFYRAYW